MFKSHLQVLALLIPNFCLLYAYAFPSLQGFTERHEAFGSPDLYLDVKYVGSPQRKGQTVDSESEFDGIVATDLTQNHVRGKRFIIKGQTWYTFYLEDKKFLGWLTSGENGCEPRLNYQIQKNGKIIKFGIMKAGFCS